jgi:hypothetical protein
MIFYTENVVFAVRLKIDSSMVLLYCVQWVVQTEEVDEEKRKTRILKFMRSL